LKFKSQTQPAHFRRQTIDHPINDGGNFGRQVDAQFQIKRDDADEGYGARRLVGKGESS
jgi:hypothetical protein